MTPRTTTERAEETTHFRGWRVHVGRHSVLPRRAVAAGVASQVAGVHSVPLAVQASRRFPLWSPPTRCSVRFMPAEEVRDVEGQDPGGTLGERLSSLFARASEEQGRHVTHQDAADWMTDHGYAVRRAYITQLVSGKRKSPSERIIEGLAAFFQVPVSVLGDQADAVRSRERLERALEDSGVQAIALRSEGLSKDSLRAVMSYLDFLRSRDQLPRANGNDQPPAGRPESNRDQDPKAGSRSRGRGLRRNGRDHR